MPTSYTIATELMVLNEFCNKIDLEEGVAHFEKSESPDGIIHTQAGKTIGIEVTSAIRTNDSAKKAKDKDKLAIFLNKFGLYDPNSLPRPSITESFTNDAYIQSLLSKIGERIQDKEANPAYYDFKSKFHKSILVVYLDDPLLDSNDLERINAQSIFSKFLHIFDEVFLYIRPTYHGSSIGIKYMGGFYLIGQKRET